MIPTFHYIKGKGGNCIHLMICPTHNEINARRYLAKLTYYKLIWVIFVTVGYVAFKEYVTKIGKIPNYDIWVCNRWLNVSNGFKAGNGKHFVWVWFNSVFHKYT